MLQHLWLNKLLSWFELHFISKLLFEILSNFLYFSNLKLGILFNFSNKVFEGTATGSNVKTIKFNGDTGANYSCTTITGNGTSALSGQYTNSYLDVTNSFSNRQMTIVHVMNYANSTTNKTYLSRHSCAAVCTDTVVGLWRSTAAITSITINTGTANDFNAGSVFTLYGIKAA